MMISSFIMFSHAKLIVNWSLKRSWQQASISYVQPSRNQSGKVICCWNARTSQSHAGTYLRNIHTLFIFLVSAGETVSQLIERVRIALDVSETEWKWLKLLIGELSVAPSHTISINGKRTVNQRVTAAKFVGDTSLFITHLVKMQLNRNWQWRFTTDIKWTTEIDGARLQHNGSQMVGRIVFIIERPLDTSAEEYRMKRWPIHPQFQTQQQRVNRTILGRVEGWKRCHYKFTQQPIPERIKQSNISTNKRAFPWF
jgi:hypothetical protein